MQGSLFEPEAMSKAFAGHDAVVNLATHIPSLADAIKPGAWREDDRIRTEAAAFRQVAASCNPAWPRTARSGSFSQPSPELASLALVRGYHTASWRSATIFTIGAAIAGLLLRGGPLAPRSGHTQPSNESTNRPVSGPGEEEWL